MSGHNKWSKIKHKKAAEDLKKGKIFSKLAQQITAAAREGGGDPDMNPSLRLLIDKAKSESMPQNNIDRAVDRGSGDSSNGLIFEPITYEGFGPAGVSMIVDVLTDNKNRVVADLRTIFNDYDCSLGESGSVSWNFDQKGLITVKCGKLEKSEKFGQDDKFVPIPKDEVMMSLMEIEGVHDIIESSHEEGLLEVYTDVVDMGNVRDAIQAKEYIINDARLIKRAKNPKDYSDEDLEKIANFIDKVDDYPDVQKVWTDADPNKILKYL